MGIKVDLSGMKFGLLTAIKSCGKTKAGQYIWLCQCQCGNHSRVIGSNLIRGNTRACGCVRIESARVKNLTHNMAKTRIWNIWTGVRKRCYNKNCKSYKHYGGRGIKMSDSWLESFENFYADMKDGYADHLTLDRKNPDGNYEKNNCRWATSKQQNNNRRNNARIVIDGESKTIAEWADMVGIRQSTISARMRLLQWDAKSAVFEPLHSRDIGGISKYLIF